MPIYEYRCERGHTFEVLQRMSDDPLSSCQTCSAPVHRVFHPVAVHFKGSGFYNTDYGTRKRSNESNEAGEGSSGGDKSESGAKDDGASKTGSKSDTSKSETSKSAATPANSD